MKCKYCGNKNAYFVPSLLGVMAGRYKCKDCGRTTSFSNAIIDSIFDIPKLEATKFCYQRLDDEQHNLEENC